MVTVVTCIAYYINDNEVQLENINSHKRLDSVVVAFELNAAVSMLCSTGGSSDSYVPVHNNK